MAVVAVKMGGMAKTKSGRGPGRPPKYPKAPGQARSTVRVQIALRPAILEAVDKYRASLDFHPDRSAVIERLIEREMVSLGFYEPPPEAKK